MLKIRALGIHGSEEPGAHLCSILVNETSVIDAGSITSTLSIEEQKKIRNIFTTHSHLDHIKDIAFIADNLKTAITEPINIISSKEVLDILKNNFLNDLIWPDFTKIPDPEHPTLKYMPIPLNTDIKIDNLKVKIVHVEHIVPTVAFFISSQTSTLLFSSDMGPSDKIWETANQMENLKAIFIDLSLPEELKEIAVRSKHFTPSDLCKELVKLKKDVKVFGHHIKSPYKSQIEKELKKYCPQVTILKEGAELSF